MFCCCLTALFMIFVFIFILMHFKPKWLEFVWWSSWRTIRLVKKSNNFVLVTCIYMLSDMFKLKKSNCFVRLCAASRKHGRFSCSCPLQVGFPRWLPDVKEPYALKFDQLFIFDYSYRGQLLLARQTCRLSLAE